MEEGELSAFQSALCGSVAGAIAGFITCPLDVTKTRMMLTKPGETEAGFAKTMQQIVRKEGAAGLFGGVGPRVVWMSLGGLIFLGCYEQAKTSLIDVV